jgi:hypothetical protein
MYQKNELKREIKEAKRLHLSWRTRLLIFIIGAPTTFLFALYERRSAHKKDLTGPTLLEMDGYSGLALPLMIIVGVLSLVILSKWKLKRHAWFWITMTVVAALHVPIILFVPWTTRWVPALAITVIASADFCLILWVLSVVGKFVDGPKAAEG